MKKFIDSEDCIILREDNFQRLIDNEGNTICVFDKSWKNDQIWHALRFANSIYNKGFEIGMFTKQNDIKKVLGII